MGLAMFEIPAAGSNRRLDIQPINKNDYIAIKLNSA
jgi:hypothetical protein